MAEAKIFEVSYSLKQVFFDRVSVINRLTKAEHRQLSKIGAFIRRRARSSLRRRKKTSEPGKPPSVHSNDDVASLKNILFGLDTSNNSVVIGPIKLRQKKTSTITVPSLMEFGGTVSTYQERLIDRSKKRGKMKEMWWKFDGKKVAYKEYRLHAAVYPARPFMRPALDKEIEKGTLKDAWLGAVSA